MNARKLMVTALVAVGATLASADTLSNTNPIGPGGVIHTVREFLAAIDAGDEKKMNSLLATNAHGSAFGFSGEAQEVRQLSDAGPTLHDVAANGKAIAASGVESPARTFLGSIAQDGLELQTTIQSIRADCPSDLYSFAVIEFSRAYGSGEDRKVVNLLATALVRHSTDGFRLFHWHASQVQ